MEMTNNEQTFFIAIFFISAFCGLVLLWHRKKLNVNARKEAVWKTPLTKDQKAFRIINDWLMLCGCGLSAGGMGVVNFLYNLIKNS
jgi:hypothetical protein